MGCNTSAVNVVHPVAHSTSDLKSSVLPALGRSYTEIWNALDESLSFVKSPKVARDKHRKTIHLYVASTFADFHNEREILATKVFPEIKRWCDQLSIQLVLIDLRWGLVKEVQTADFLTMCLKEIDRCSEHGMPVFFIGLLSGTLGWVPSLEQIGKEKRNLFGLSLLEMELIHGAYLNNNPNAIFALRDSSFLSGLSTEQLKDFIEPQNEGRIGFIKSKLRSKFCDQVFAYQCQVVSQDHMGLPRLDISGIFQKVIVDFFLNKFRKEFALESIARSLEIQNEYHKQELKRLCATEIYGKAAVIAKIEAYIEAKDSRSPLLLLGERGSGKSSILAKCIQKYLLKEQVQPAQAPKNNSVVKDLSDSTPFSSRRSVKKGHDMSLQDMDDASSNDSLTLQDMCSTLRESSSWLVFYHFVGHSPYSSELGHILQRIWSTRGIGEPRTIHKSVEVNTVAKDVLHLLSTTEQQKFVLFIDGIDRIKDEHHSHVLKWIPAKLPQNVRIIVTLSLSSDTRKALAAWEPKCVEVSCGTLSLASSTKLISNFLSQYGVTSSTEMTSLLLGKLGISNPLYIQEICKEIAHTTGAERKPEAEVEALPGDLESLYDHIISRLEEEADSRLVIATLCLLECAHHGLLESELLELLGALSPQGYRCDSSDIHSQNSRTDVGTRHNMLQNTESSLHLYKDADSNSAVYTTGNSYLAVQGNTGQSQLDVLQRGSSPYNSQVQLRLPRESSHGTPSDLEDNESVQHSSNFHGLPKGSPVQSLLLPGAVIATDSPHMYHREHSVNDLARNAHSSRFNSSNENIRKPHKLPPSPTLSLISTELNRKTSPASLCHSPEGASEVQVDTEIMEVRPSSSCDQQSCNHNSSQSRLVGLEKMNAINFSSPLMTGSRLIAYSWALLLHKLGPYLQQTGRPGECRWALGTVAFSRAIRRKYFKYPVTMSFPFSFCTSTTFFGADRDPYLQSLRSPPIRSSQTFSPISFRASVSHSRSSNNSDIVQKRFDWWRARLAGYFATCLNEERRAEELPYHLAHIRDNGRLTHCLSYLPTFERLSREENIIDLLRLWKYTGQSAVLFYQQALAQLEAGGASAQEMVSCMQKVAQFFHHAGELDAAENILVDAIELEVTKLGGRSETMAALTLSITKTLSLSSRQQALVIDPRECLEREYRLLRFASQSVEFHRKLPAVGTIEQNLAQLLLLLSIHLHHYALLGGSADLSVRNAIEQAQEAAQEAVELYMKAENYAQLLEAYIVLAATYNNSPRKALELLQTAQHLCRQMFGELNNAMLRIIYNIALIYDKKMSSAKARTYYNKWTELATAMHGKDYHTSALAKEHTAEIFQFTVQQAYP